LKKNILESQVIIHKVNVEVKINKTKYFVLTVVTAMKTVIRLVQNIVNCDH
jgi:hypothetical protein